jgi:hypothetical protein
MVSKPGAALEVRSYELSDSCRKSLSVTRRLQQVGRSIRADPEPKDRMSDEWYAWNDRKTDREYGTLPLNMGQPSLSSSGLSMPRGLDELVGGKVVGVGFHPSAKEGGMAIDFEKGGKPMRIVFGYTELGLWVYWVGERKC